MKTVLKWTVRVGAGLVGVVVLALIVLYGWSSHRLGKIYQIAPATVLISQDPESLDHGRHILNTRGCRDCHGEDLGGTIFIDDPVLGRLAASNLTSGQGGIGSRYSDADWVKAIRHGLGPDGKPLIFMPSYEYHPLDDRDLGALIAHLKSLEPVDRELPSTRVGPLGRLLYLTGELPLVAAEMIDHALAIPEAPPRGPTAAYGEYLTATCTGCHGPGFSGGRVPGAPPAWPTAANLTPHESGLASWSFDEFETALRTGVRPDGRQMEPQFMPWVVTNHLTDEEMRAVWAFLQSLPPAEAGNR